MEDTELVSAFLEATSRMSLAEAGQLAGVAHTTVRRWRAGYGTKDGWKELQARNRRMMEDYLASLKNHTAVATVPHADVIHLPEWLQEVIRNDAKAAVLRAEALRDFGRAARLEAEHARAREGLTSGSSDWKVLGAQGEVAVASVEFQEGTRPEQTTPPPPPSSQVDGKERSDE